MIKSPFKEWALHTNRFHKVMTLQIPIQCKDDTFDRKVFSQPQGLCGIWLRLKKKCVSVGERGKMETLSGLLKPLEGEVL